MVKLPSARTRPLPPKLKSTGPGPPPGPTLSAGIKVTMPLVSAVPIQLSAGAGIFSVRTGWTADRAVVGTQRRAEVVVAGREAVDTVRAGVVGLIATAGGCESALALHRLIAQ